MALKMADLPSHKGMVKNILYVWAIAGPDDMQEGMTWYAEAFNECKRIADKYDMDVATVAALVSVVSPSIMWGGNISAPERIIDLYERAVPAADWTGFNIYPHNLVKAEMILNGDMTVLKGNKVQAFFQNIMGNATAVTIDRWALRVALDDPKLGKDKIIPGSKKVYNAVADAYREAANIVGQDVPDVQAVTWTVFRNRYNGKVRKEKKLAKEAVTV